MSALIHTLPGGERNPALIMARRKALVARPDVQAKFAELEALLIEYRAMKGLVNETNGKRIDSNKIV